MAHPLSASFRVAKPYSNKAGWRDPNPRLLWMTLRIDPSRAGTCLRRASAPAIKRQPESGAATIRGSVKLPYRRFFHKHGTRSFAPRSVLAFTPTITRNAPRQDPVRERESRNRNVKIRSSVGFGTVDVKKRLIELWHQSSARCENFEVGRHFRT